MSVQAASQTQPIDVVLGAAITLIVAAGGWRVASKKNADDVANDLFAQATGLSAEYRELVAVLKREVEELRREVQDCEAKHATVLQLLADHGITP